MDIAQFTAEINSTNIKYLTQYHVLSIFCQNDWSIKKSDITSPVLLNYAQENLDNIITSNSTYKWLFIKDTTYTISIAVQVMWYECAERVYLTEAEILNVIQSEQHISKELIENTIKKLWRGTAAFVFVRDIIRCKFDMSDMGMFHTIMRVHETYSRRSRKLASDPKFIGHFDMVHCYDDNEDNFLCDFLILDLINDGLIDFDFINESGLYDEYRYSITGGIHSDNHEFDTVMNGVESFELAPMHDWMPNAASDGAHIGDINTSTEIKLNDASNEVPSEPIQINISYEDESDR